MTVKKAREEWMRSITKNNNRAAQTIETYRTRLNQLDTDDSNILNKQTKELTDKDFQAIIDKMYNSGYKSSTIKSTYDSLHVFCEWMQRKNLIAFDILDTVKIPETEAYTPIILTSDKMNQVIGYAKNTDMYLPVLIACKTGLRRSQVLALLWSDIDFDNRIISISKNLIRSKTRTFSSGKERKPRVIKMPEELTTVLKEVYEYRRAKNPTKDIQNDFVCQTINSKPFEASYFDKKFRRFVNEYNLPEGLRFHDLRWSYINTEVRKKGIKEVSEIVGHHSSIYCLDYYYRSECA